MRAVATAFWGGALWTAACCAGACFTGKFLAGQPCVSDGDCGPSLRCEDGVCGGLAGTTGAGGSTTITGESTMTPTAPTTSGSMSAGESQGEITGTGTTASSGGESSSEVSGDTQSSDRCADATCGPIDILLIIDDSPSMAQWQPALEVALQGLDAGPVGEVLRGSCDVHVGVLATGALYAANPPPCQGLGSLVRIGAKLCPGGAPYATGADDLTPALGCRIGVGSDGPSDERPIQALLQAMTPELNDAGGCNDGFFRPESVLVVLLVTDEDDDADPEDEAPGQQTPGTPKAWFDSVIEFKGSADRVVMLALLGESEPVTLCPWIPEPGDADGSGAEAPERLRSFIDLFPRRAIDTLCQDDYTGFTAGPVHTQLQAACAAGRTP